MLLFSFKLKENSHDCQALFSLIFKKYIDYGYSISPLLFDISRNLSLIQKSFLEGGGLPWHLDENIQRKQLEIRAQLLDNACHPLQIAVFPHVHQEKVRPAVVYGCKLVKVSYGTRSHSPARVISLAFRIGAEQSTMITRAMQDKDSVPRYFIFRQGNVSKFLEIKKFETYLSNKRIHI